MIKISLLLLVGCSLYTALARRSKSRAGRSALRVYEGYPDTQGRFPYVVSLVSKRYRMCTGTLIAPIWVLTAAHCDHPLLVAIQYGNITVPPWKARAKRRVLNFFRHPGHIYEDRLKPGILIHDIALARVEELRMSAYGRVSAVDYKTLVGFAVEYAGYGRTFDRHTKEEKLLDNQRPLQLGKGLMTVCINQNWSYGPFVCVVRQCSNMGQHMTSGDSGGPLVHDGKVIAVYSNDRRGYVPQGEKAYTPVSPYVGWIQHIIAKYITYRG